MATTGTTPYYGLTFATGDTAVADFPAVSQQQAEKTEAVLKTANVPPGNPDVNAILLRLNALEAQLNVRMLTATTHLDTLTETSVWMQTADPATGIALGYPRNGAGGLLKVTNTGNNIFQSYRARGGYNNFYIRAAVGSTWQAWKLVTAAAAV